MDVAQKRWQPGQLLPLTSPLPLAVLHPPRGTTAAPETGLGNSAGLKVSFSFAWLFLTQIGSPIQVTV